MREDIEKYKFGICDVEENYNFYFKWLLAKLHDLFIWKNIPDHIDVTALNNELFLNGQVCWTEMKDGKVYPLYGNVSGRENAFYCPTKYIIANPVLGSKSVNIDPLNGEVDGIMMYNSPADKTFTWLPGSGGLYQLIKQTATLLADNIVSINTAQINSRVNTIVTADSVQLKNSAEEYLKRLYSGKPYTVMDENLLENIHINPVSSPQLANVLAQLIELHQYIIAQFFNNIGIKTNPVNKKERLITGEIDSVDNFLAVNLNEMLKSRQVACALINAMFDMDISVELAEELKPVLEQSIEPDSGVPEGMFTAGGEEVTDGNDEGVSNVDSASATSKKTESDNEDSTTPVETSEPAPVEDNQEDILEKSDTEILEERFIGDNPIPEKTESVEDITSNESEDDEDESKT